ncbi:MAG TPA: hypothetical protein VEB43_08685 [Anaeromyxobacter sp.]|nr:hypothetical protein [Anaeromyxobacter sp.]
MASSSCRALAVVLGFAPVTPAVVPAAAPDPGAYVRTGDAILKANHWPFTVELLSVRHDMRDLPAERSRRAVVELDGDKRLTLHTLRELPTERLTSWLRDGLEAAGYRDDERIRAFLSGFPEGNLRKDEEVVIQYDAAAQLTTVTSDRGAPVRVDGVSFMRAIWTVWFGKLGDGLVSRL